MPLRDGGSARKNQTVGSGRPRNICSKFKQRHYPSPNAGQHDNLFEVALTQVRSLEKVVEVATAQRSDGTLSDEEFEQCMADLMVRLEVLKQRMTAVVEQDQVAGVKL